MSANYHEPVMLSEVLQYLDIQENGIYVDATFGGGGHSRAILSRLGPRGKLIAFDRDPDAAAEALADPFFAKASQEGRFVLIGENFSYLKNHLRFKRALPVNGILADLGVSSHQFDVAERGFSTRLQGPLDMRMDRCGDLTAAAVLRTYAEEELARVFSLYGELPHAGRLAAAVVKARAEASGVAANTRTEATGAAANTRTEATGAAAKSRTEATGAAVNTRTEASGVAANTRTEATGAAACNFQYTDTTAAFFGKFAPKGRENRYLAQVFQALRIEVNGELEALRELLRQSLEVLETGGRLVVISYHSLEDRMVKNFMRTGNVEGREEKDFYGNRLSPIQPVVRKAVVPGSEEIERNPRARSAKLRAAEIIGGKEADNGKE